MDVIFLAIVFAIGVTSGVTASVAGFGIGSLLTPILLLRLGPDLAIAAVAIPHILATALRLYQHREAVDPHVLRRFGWLSAAGGALGGLLYARLGGQMLTVVLGGLLIATALWNLLPRLGQWHPRGAIVPALGFLSGLFGGIAGNQGGLRTAALLTFDLSPRALVATSTAVALLVDVARTPVYLARAGASLLPYAAPVGVAAVGCLLGTVLGERVLLGLSVSRYRRIVGGAVGLLGVWLLVRATGS